MLKIPMEIQKENNQSVSPTKHFLVGFLIALLATGTFVAGAKVANSQMLSGQEANLLNWLFGRNKAPVEEVDLGEFLEGLEIDGREICYC